MSRTLTITMIAFSFLCIAPSALTLSLAVSSTAPAGDGRPQAQLPRDWTRFPPADRAVCLKSKGSGAYTELLQCLETQWQARQRLDASPTVGQGGGRS